MISQYVCQEIECIKLTARKGVGLCCSTILPGWQTDELGKNEVCGSCLNIKHWTWKVEPWEAMAVSHRRSKDSGLFWSGDIGIGTVVCSERASDMSDLIHPPILVAQKSSAPISKKNRELAEASLEELVQPGKLTAESARNCKLIFALNNDRFPKTKSRSKEISIRGFAAERKKWLDTLQSKHPQIGNAF